MANSSIINFNVVFNVKQNRHYMRNCARERLAAVTFPFTILHSNLYAPIPKFTSRANRTSIENGEEENVAI